MSTDLSNLRIISAGAGSGKTFRLTSEMVQLLQEGVRPSGIIATTFTKKAAAELQERVRVRLLEAKMSAAADELENALIGTVHGLGVRLLHRFAFEAGVSPEVAIMADEDQSVLFNQSLSTVLTESRVREMERLSDRLGLHKRGPYDWRQDVHRLSEMARSNGFDAARLEESKIQSIESFKTFLTPVSALSPDEWNSRLGRELEEAIERLSANGDETKVTSSAVQLLRNMRRELQLRGELFWYQWASISKLKVGAKSRDAIEDLVSFTADHYQNKAFHQDIEDFISILFSISTAALEEYANYKNSRGLIDYTDMEVLVNKLLDQQAIQEVLQTELDLLMVDEFQDTSPIQLEIFLKLSRFAKYSVWVGDPKQSIYGFRGAEPQLMEAIIQKVGGIRATDIQRFSWRSREEIVWVVNAIFTKAFPQWPAEQVALEPKRRKKATDKTANKADESDKMGRALIHWHFDHDTNSKRPPGSPWMENALAEALRLNLQKGITISPKGGTGERLAIPGDVAILCRSNNQCLRVAEALHKAGLKAAISRAGLLKTAEAKLVLACLKFVLNKYDTLSVAEVLLLAEQMPLENIIEHRLDYLDTIEKDYEDFRWAEDRPIIKRLHSLREEVAELSSAEILTLLLEELDLRRLVSAWGQSDQRLGNVAAFSKLALQYEEACNRLHAAASLGGFLLWLAQLERSETDWQASGENTDAVNVLTYHRSKGLEWPVVICHSLEQKLRGDVWGLAIVSEQTEVDLNQVLGQRWIRYWVNPYSDQHQSTVLYERLQASAAQAEASQNAMQEEARLLYVGLTRARDYLVLPTRNADSIWLNRVCNDGQEDNQILDKFTDETAWHWADHFLDKQTETYIFAADFPVREVPEEAIRYLGARGGKKEILPYSIDLYKESDWPEKEYDAVFETYGKAPEWPVGVETYRTGKAVKAFFNADYSEYSLTHRKTMLEDMLTRYELEDSLDNDMLLDQSAAFRKWIANHYSSTRIIRKFPINQFIDGRLFDTVVDLLLETDQGYIIIQNSGFSGDAKKHAQKLRELASWAKLVEQAIKQLHPNATVHTWIHFVAEARLGHLRPKDQRSLFD
ncbi:MAG: UvrD-helicase domain-containing protein [Saprospiraceae bacterium]|nr:UvrD-helicase domain-containing protein [Saprospiraceae bacterium]